MPGVGPIGFGALLVPTPSCGLRRLGEMHLSADRLQLLHHEPPPGGRLQRHLELVAAEPAKEPPHTRPVRGPHARPADLAGGRVDPLSRDLRAMLIESHHDRHLRSPALPKPAPVSSTTRAVTRAASSPTHRIPWATVGTSY